MIDQTIKYRPFPSIFTLLFALGTIAFLAGGFLGTDRRVAMGAVCTGAITIALFLTRKRSFSARITETGLEIANPERVIPYAKIESLTAAGKAMDPLLKMKRRFDIYITQGENAIVVPRRINLPSDELYRFLMRQIPPRSEGQLVATLQPYRIRQEEKWGEQQVWCYGERKQRNFRPRGRRVRAFGLALVISGIIFGIFGFTEAKESDKIGWFAGGFGLFFYGGLTWLVGMSIPRTTSNLVKKGPISMVLSPDGLAMMQGDMRGELRWQELLDARLQSKPPFQITLSRAYLVPAGIFLKVRGTEIVIADVYDRPLPLIYQQLCYYWRNNTFGPVTERRTTPARNDEVLDAIDAEGIVSGED